MYKGLGIPDVNDDNNVKPVDSFDLSTMYNTVNSVSYYQFVL